MSENRKIEELDLVALVRDVPAHGLVRGDVGTVVHLHTDGRSYEVEFAAGDGMTIAVLTLPSTDVRPLGSRDILHVREVAPR